MTAMDSEYDFGRPRKPRLSVSEDGLNKKPSNNLSPLAKALLISLTILGVAAIAGVAFTLVYKPQEQVPEESSSTPSHGNMAMSVLPEQFPSVDCPSFASLGPDGTVVTVNGMLLMRMGAVYSTMPTVEGSGTYPIGSVKSFVLEYLQDDVLVIPPSEDAMKIDWRNYVAHGVQVTGARYNCSLEVYSVNDMRLVEDVPNIEEYEILSRNGPAEVNDLIIEDDGDFSAQIGQLINAEELGKCTCTKTSSSATSTSTSSSSSSTKVSTTTSISSTSTKVSTTTSVKPSTTSTSTSTTRTTTTTTTSSASPTPTSISYEAPRKTAMIFFYFANDAKIPFTPEKGRFDTFENPNLDNLNKFFPRVSYGKTGFVGKSSEQVDIFGWIKISASNADNCNILDWTREAERIAGIDFRDYAHRIFVPNNAPKCGWAGVAYMPGTWSALQSGAISAPDVAAHELGHNLGYHHSGAITCQNGASPSSLTGGCSAVEYDDKYEVMGYGGKAKPYHLHHRHRLFSKYLPASSIASITKSQRFTIQNINTENPNGQLLGLMYKLPTVYTIQKDSTMKFYYFELFSSKNLPKGAPCAVMIRLGDDYSIMQRKSNLIKKHLIANTAQYRDSMLVSEFTDSVQGLSLKVVSFDGCKSATIEATLL